MKANQKKRERKNYTFDIHINVMPFHNDEINFDTNETLVSISMGSIGLESAFMPLYVIVFVG